MTMKELTAGVQLTGVVLAVAWLALDYLALSPGTASVAGTAVKLIWVVAAMLVFNLVASVASITLVSVLQQQSIEDGPMDERDRAIEAKSLKNSAIITSSAAALALIPLAMGADPVFAVYALFIAPVLGGAANAVSQLIYYRIG
jgi:hypothetical protein